MRKSVSGFTIIELLIVIVVIAILAAISVVAYTGIQQRANNAKTLSAVNAYVKALNLYKIDQGQHPATGQACLGNAYESGGCDSTASLTIDADGLNTTYLAPYLNGSVPMPAANRGLYSGGRYLGGAGYFWNNLGYGGTNNGGIGLYYQGGGSCPTIGSLTYISTQAYSDGSGRWCRYSIN